MEGEQKFSIRIGRRVFATAVVVLAALMLVSGIAGRLLPAGVYDRQETGGRLAVIPGTYHRTDTAPLPVWRWLTAPLESLAGEDGPTIIVIIVFLLFLAGSFSILSGSGALHYAVGKLAARFSRRRYALLWIVSFFFMALGSFMGIFEESVILTPVAVALCVGLGFDVFTGLAVSLLATGFGFTAGVLNPFTTGVAQQLAGLPLFSGAPYRLLAFVLIYLLMMAFITGTAHKAGRGAAPLAGVAPETPRGARRALIVMGVFFVMIVAWVAAASRVESLGDYTMPALALLFLSGGIAAGLYSGVGPRKTMKLLWTGMSGAAPGIVLILMAASIKYIMQRSGVLDTIIYEAERSIGGMGPIPAAMAVYLLVLVLEFFIGSGSAKAFLVIPLIAPLASLIGLSSQTAILAFQFGDGFANVFYVTNPVLLITLGITGVSYGEWFRRTAVLQIAALALTAAMVGAACLIGYA